MARTGSASTSTLKSFNNQVGLRILIARLSHIGDCIATLPVACAIRTALPEATIGWVVESPSNQLLEHHPAIDELIVIPSGFVKRPRQLNAIRKRLKQFRPDVVIDPQSLMKSSLLGWLSGAKLRIGLARPAGREIAPLLNNKLINKTSTHIVDHSLELLKPIGIETPKVEFRLPANTAAAKTIDKFIAQSDFQHRFVLINSGAGWASRRWPADRFAVVARHLAQQYQIPSVVAWAGEEEKKLAMQIIAESNGHAQIAPKTNLVELTELLRRSYFYLGSDTGPMHIAAAVGTTCLSLFGPTLPSYSGAYGSQHSSVQTYHQSTDRKTSNAAMLAIKADDVCKAVDQLLNRLNAATFRNAG